MNYLSTRHLGHYFYAFLVGLCTLTLTLVPAKQAFALDVSPSSVQVGVGANVPVSVTNRDGTVRVSTSNSAVATVSYASGVATIHGVAAGSATVTIRDSENQRQVSVTVRPGLTVSPTSVTVAIGSTASVSVSNRTGSVSATSANTAIATVSYDSGTATIRGRAAGSTTVTISDSVSARTVAVTVTGGVAALTVSPTSVTVAAGSTAPVSVTNASGTVTATSANSAVATVTYAAGVATIRGVAAGSTTVTISDSDESRTVAVTVTASAALTVSPTVVSVATGATALVSVTNASGTVTATSANTAVATVTYAAGAATIRGVTAGSTTITIRDSANSRTVAVTVTAGIGLTVTPSALSITVGNTAPALVTNATGTVTSNSSNTAIATVTYAAGTATIRGVAAGSATITIADSLNSRTVAVTVVTATAANYTLLAWNNLGMHCIDGVDYSIFSILPPLNVLNAQLKDKAGALVTTGVTLTYQATPDLTGSINTISSTKTNFWTYAPALFGLNPAPEVGLLGYPMASNTPASMAFNTTNNWFEAVGIPITNYDDTMAKNEYPMVQVVAKNAAGQTLASTKVVLPVSDELKCTACHTSNTGTNAAANAARPTAGWVFDPNPVLDWKKNILRIHDQKQAGSTLFASAMAAKGYGTSLFASAQAGKPVLCVACHSSNAYQIDAGFPTGYPGVTPLTQAIHNLHSGRVDPANGLTLDNSNNRTACYNCHPGSATQCLRGAMSASTTQCQNCHGNLTNVGKTTRQGWLSMPGCQSCHFSSTRAASALNASGNPVVPADQTFGTSANVPSSGFNLYRFSTGHGGMKCSACHGSTHAEFPSTEANDNAQSIATQGHTGTIHECTACHTTAPSTTTGGPHGLHTIGTAWVSNHPSVARAGTAACAYCHGADFRGSPLSQVKMSKTVGPHTYAAGQAVTCYDCHNGPTGSELTAAAKKFAAENHSKGLFEQLVSGVKRFLNSLTGSAEAEAATRTK